MKLKITNQAQEFTASINADSFENALSVLFQNPNYCLAADAEDQPVAYGIDLLKGAVITGIQVQIDEEAPASYEQANAAYDCYQKLVGLASNLISLAGEEPRYTPMGAFNPDWERINEIRLISAKTYAAVRGAKAVFFNTTIEDANVTARVAKEIIDACPDAEEDINRAMQAWTIQHAQD